MWEHENPVVAAATIRAQVGGRTPVRRIETHGRRSRARDGRP
jgi:hypothetical protein